MNCAPFLKTSRRARAPHTHARSTTRQRSAPHHVQAGSRTALRSTLVAAVLLLCLRRSRFVRVCVCACPSISLSRARGLLCSALSGLLCLQLCVWLSVLFCLSFCLSLALSVFLSPCHPPPCHHRCHPRSLEPRTRLAAVVGAPGGAECV